MAFNPAKHIPLSKSLATIGFPMVAQSYYYDETLFVYRPYVDIAEVNAYISAQFRGGGFDIIINFGGTLSGGVITGGENKVYWYDQGLTDADLKPKGGGGNANIGSVDKPSTGTLLSPTGVYTFTDEELALMGNDPAVSAYVPSVGLGNTVETFYPDITPIITKDSDGNLISVQVDFGEDGGMIRFTGANAGVTPTPGGGGLELGETSTTAYRGDRGKTAYDYAIAHNLVDNTPDAGKPVSTAQQAALDNKVDKEVGKGLSENDYTDAEKTKLANLSDYFKGRYASLAALQSAFPVGEDGDYATVDTVGVDAITYIWDETDAEWVPGNPGSVTTINGQTGAVILDADDIGDGATNKYWTIARTLGSVLTGFIPGTVIDSIVSTDTVLQAFQKVQGYLDSLVTLLAFKASIAAGTGTSTALTFGFDSVQGTIASPLTGNITGSASNANLGVTVLVIHNNGTEPTFDSKFKKLSGSGDYVTGQVNYIYCQYIDATHIIYSINQSA